MLTGVPLEMQATVTRSIPGPGTTVTAYGNSTCATSYSTVYETRPAHCPSTTPGGPIPRPSTVYVTTTAPGGPISPASTVYITTTAPGGPVSPASTVYITTTAPGGVSTVTEPRNCPSRGISTYTSTCYETVTGNCPSATPGGPVSPPTTVTITESSPPETCSTETVTITTGGGGWSGGPGTYGPAATTTTW